MRTRLLGEIVWGYDTYIQNQKSPSPDNLAGRVVLEFLYSLVSLLRFYRYLDANHKPRNQSVEKELIKLVNWSEKSTN